ncbi:MAG: efflux RND transporter permease subunit [Gammaproteobacteria bacterium]|nr:efflux RND transporter permease subunit [Gammaproteobacteria bacterium]
MKKTNADVSQGRGSFAVTHRVAILFITLALTLAGWYSAQKMPASVFPETNFPRCVVLIDNGVMPADEMMASITRPIEEAVKNIPGVVQVRSATGRGSAEVNVFFDWQTDMVQSELYLLSRIAELKSKLPASATSTVWRLTFNAFPIMGISLTSPERSMTELWELARYDLKPRFLRIEGVGRVDLVGGRVPEYHVVVDPLKLAAAQLALSDVSTALEQENWVSPAGFHTENYTLYLTLIDGRVRNLEELKNLTIAVRGQHPIQLSDIARIERGEEPVFNVVTAQGERAVLLNVRAQPSGANISLIADELKAQLAELRQTLPADVQLSFYYDQSQLVKESVESVWEAILIGLLFAFFILYAFLKNWGSVMTAIVVIPVSVLATIVVMFAAKMSFNLMTLGGIAAAIGLIIDDAIVVVESIHAHIMRGEARLKAIRSALKEIIRPLIASTLTPVVVFIPMAFLDGLPGVFFRALALTMVVSLLTSLLLALTLTPALSSLFVKEHPKVTGEGEIKEHAGFLLKPLLALFSLLMRMALRFRWLVLLLCGLFIWQGGQLYNNLQSDFMPEMDEGGFVIDYHTDWGTSLEETDRMLRQAETILMSLPEVEGYSRRTGARLALAIAEPNTGDFLVKLHADHQRPTEEVKSELRDKLNRALPGVEWEFPGILGDLIGDLTWSPNPIEVKLFSNDIAWLSETAPKVQALIDTVPGVVDTSDGLVNTGPTLTFKIRHTAAKRFGFSAQSIATAVNTALLGRATTTVLEGDRRIAIRIRMQDQQVKILNNLKKLPLRSASGALITLDQVADVSKDQGQLELHREDLRQLIAVTGDLEGVDTGSAIAAIKTKLTQELHLPGGVIEYGGLFEQQVKAFQNLLMVLVLGTMLVFTVLLIEFRSFLEPIAIVAGSLLALIGSIMALHFTATSLNIISFLGAIIGVGIVAKNGILMLDLVDHFIAEGEDTATALLRSGQRRLRPILMTSTATILAMLPMAWGAHHGADMLRPLAISIIGALSVSLLFSLLVTPSLYLLLSNLFQRKSA